MKRHDFFALIYAISLIQIPIAVTLYVALGWKFCGYLAVWGGVPAVIIAVTGLIEPKEVTDEAS